MNDLKTYVGFNCCKLAKEKGFSNGSDHYWEHALTESVDAQDGTSGPFGWKKGETNFQSGYFINKYKGTDYTSENWFMCEAPTQAELQKWLRDEKKIDVLVNIYSSNPLNYCVSIYSHEDELELDRLINFNSYEEALAAGIIKALNFI